MKISRHTASAMVRQRASSTRTHELGNDICRDVFLEAGELCFRKSTRAIRVSSLNIVNERGRPATTEASRARRRDHRCRDRHQGQRVMDRSTRPPPRRRGSAGSGFEFGVAIFDDMQCGARGLGRKLTRNNWQVHHDESRARIPSLPPGLPVFGEVIQRTNGAIHGNSRVSMPVTRASVSVPGRMHTLEPRYSGSSSDTSQERGLRHSSWSPVRPTAR